MGTESSYTCWGERKGVLERFDVIVTEMRRILAAKWHDYADATDPFKNFRQVASIMSSLLQEDFSELHVCLMHLIHKIQRVSNLIFTKKDPVNESVRDNLVDLANYAVILLMLWEMYSEEEGNTQKRCRKCCGKHKEEH